MLAGEAEVAFAAPDLTDDSDGLVKGLEGLPTPAPLASVGLDCIPKRSGAKAEFEAATAESVDRRCRLGQHGGGPHEDGQVVQLPSSGSPASSQSVNPPE